MVECHCRMKRMSVYLGAQFRQITEMDTIHETHMLFRSYFKEIKDFFVNYSIDCLILSIKWIVL